MKELKVKYIDIVFENCESVRLTPESFSQLMVNNITKSYWINCFQYGKGEVNEFINCEELYIVINNKCKKETFERIKRFNDITHIDIFFDNNKNEYISTPFDGVCANKLQKTKVVKKTDEVIIHIKKG